MGFNIYCQKCRIKVTGNVINHYYQEHPEIYHRYHLEMVKEPEERTEFLTKSSKGGMS